MAQELTALPSSFPAGTTVVYRKSLSSYPASEGWALTLHLAGAGVLTKAAATDEDAFVVTLAASDTAAPFPAGHYKWTERVSKNNEVYEAESGTVTITPDLALATEGSEQEWLERAIAALKSHIEGRLPSGMDSYSIAGRSVSKMPLREALTVLNDLEARLARLNNPGTVTRPILVSFTPTGFDR